jgi:PBP1b-binding outer membrane lipoprotein LpoB
MKWVLLMSVLLAGCATPSPMEIVKKVMERNAESRATCSCETSRADMGCSCAPSPQACVPQDVPEKRG